MKIDDEHDYEFLLLSMKIDDEHNYILLRKKDVPVQLSTGTKRISFSHGFIKLGLDQLKFSFKLCSGSIFEGPNTVTKYHT